MKIFTQCQVSSFLVCTHPCAWPAHHEVFTDFILQSCLHVLSTDCSSSICLCNLATRVFSPSQQTPCYAGAAGDMFCQGRTQQFYADPCDCTKFVQCSNGNTFVTPCGSGQVWSQSAMNCAPGTCSGQSPSSLSSPALPSSSPATTASPTASTPTTPAPATGLNVGAYAAGTSGTVTCTIYGVYPSAVLQSGVACQNEIGKYVLKQLTTAGLLCFCCDDTEMIAMCISLCATWFETVLNVCVSCSCLCISTSTLTEYRRACACWLMYVRQDLEIFLVLQVCRCFLNGDCLGCCKHAKSKCSVWPVSARAEPARNWRCVSHCN